GEVEVVQGGSGYKATKKFPAVVGDGSGAALETTLGNNGEVVSIRVITGGSGYTKPAEVEFPKPGIPFLQALRLFSERPMAVFFTVSFLITIALAFYYSFTALYLERGIRVKPQNVAPLMTIGQWVEIGFLLSLSWFLKEFGMKTILLVGMAAWGVRYAIFA